MRLFCFREKDEHAAVQVQFQWANKIVGNERVNSVETERETQRFNSSEDVCLTVDATTKLETRVWDT